MPEIPKIIQGGMGVGVSNWRLANAVSRLGQLGVVAGTALDVLFVRRLAEGDKGGHMRRAVEAFPFPEMARRIWQKYFIPGGKSATMPFRNIPMHRVGEPRRLVELCILANFVEVFLAREGHKNPVGINYLEKVQLPHLASIYGAMLAGVGTVLMGAGIPLHIPAVLDAYAAARPAEYKLIVSGASPDLDTMLHLDPAHYAEGEVPQMSRPNFLAIISSNALATTMIRRASGRVDGLVVEGKTAGGHNAPPRGKLQLTESGEPVYGERDQVNLADLRTLGVPFWLAGGYGRVGKLKEALEQGAAGIQVGTAFAFSQESGLDENIKQRLIAQAMSGSAAVLTDPRGSPTGFPFKVVQVEGTYSDAAIYQRRKSICDLGYLREPYATPEGKIGYRCAAEPLPVYQAKGGLSEDAVGRKCLCNALIANVTLAQTRQDGTTELPLVTAGDDINIVAQFIAPGKDSYTASDVVTRLLA